MGLLLPRQILRRQCHQIFWGHWRKTRSSGALTGIRTSWCTTLASEELYLGRTAPPLQPGAEEPCNEPGCLLRKQRGKVTNTFLLHTDLWLSKYLMQYLAPGGLLVTAFITCVVELEQLLTVWEGRSPGPVLPLSTLTWPTLPPIDSLLAVNSCSLRRRRYKSALVSGLFFPISSSTATVGLPVIKRRTQKHLTTGLGKRRSPGPLPARPFPSTLSVNLGRVPHFAWARGQRFLW